MDLIAKILISRTAALCPMSSSSRGGQVWTWSLIPAGQWVRERNGLAALSAHGRREAPASNYKVSGNAMTPGGPGLRRISSLRIAQGHLHLPTRPLAMDGQMATEPHTTGAPDAWAKSLLGKGAQLQLSRDVPSARRDASSRRQATLDGTRLNPRLLQGGGLCLRFLTASLGEPRCIHTT